MPILSRFLEKGANRAAGQLYRLRYRDPIASKLVESSLQVFAVERAAPNGNLHRLNYGRFATSSGVQRSLPFPRTAGSKTTPPSSRSANSLCSVRIPFMPFIVVEYLTMLSLALPILEVPELCSFFCISGKPTPQLSRQCRVDQKPFA